jgi:hypothetical protein
LAPTSQVVSQLEDLAHDSDELVRRRALVSVERLAMKIPSSMALRPAEAAHA